MPSKSEINQNSVVPLGWVIGGFVTVLSSTLVGAIVGTLWVSTVDFRLQRIEDKLGIPPAQSRASIPFTEAFADELKGKNVHSK